MMDNKALDEKLNDNYTESFSADWIEDSVKSQFFEYSLLEREFKLLLAQYQAKGLDKLSKVTDLMQATYDMISVMLDEIHEPLEDEDGEKLSDDAMQAINDKMNALYNAANINYSDDDFTKYGVNKDDFDKFYNDFNLNIINILEA